MGEALVHRSHVKNSSNACARINQQESFGLVLL